MNSEIFTTTQPLTNEERIQKWRIKMLIRRVELKRQLNEILEKIGKKLNEDFENEQRH